VCGRGSSFSGVARAGTISAMATAARMTPASIFRAPSCSGVAITAGSTVLGWYHTGEGSGATSPWYAASVSQGRQILRVNL